jgi:UDP-glucose 4-epimerase
MNVLITGGAGFIGSHIAEALQGRARVRVLDNLRSGFRANLRDLDVELVEGSILDRPLLQKAMAGVDCVFHLAAMISVPESMEKPIECEQVNTIGTLQVLEAAAAAGVRKLCFSTSAAIYGNNPDVPKRETMLPEPQSPYAVSKLSGEYYGDLFTRTRGLSCACLRYFNVFGPRQNPKSAYAAAVPIFITRALKHEPLTIYGDGEQTRDFIYVKDIAAANVYFATQSPAAGVFNVAYGGRITINDLAREIIRQTGSRSEIRYEPPRAGDVKHSQAANDRLRAAGFKPASTFAEGLAATIAWYRRQAG